MFNSKKSYNLKKYVYIDGNLDARGGGPAAYLDNLLYGLRQTKNTKNIHFLYNNKKHTIFEKKYKNKNFYVPTENCIDWTNLSNIETSINNIQNAQKQFSIPDSIADYIDINNIGLMHLHSTRDVIKMQNFFNYNEVKIPIVLTSHSPSIPHQEMKIFVSEYLGEELTNKFCSAYEIFDITAFDIAKYFIFPAKEALDEYYKWNKFESLTKNKDFYWLPTGCPELTHKISAMDYRKKYNIPQDAFVISYVGRHDIGKGYDTLKVAGKYLLNQYPNLYFLIAGNTKPIQPLEHERWVEVGYTNDPGSLINASDLFVLPNKITFYDLILIEVMSSGIPVLCTYTGGNKCVSKMSTGIITYEYGIDALILNLNNLIQTSKSNLSLLGIANKKSYNANFSLQQFAKNYVNILSQIIEREKSNNK